MTEEWDVSLSRFTGPNNTGSIQVALPSVLARALHAKKYNRAKVRVTDQGILIVPYESSSPQGRTKRVAELPKAWEKLP